MNCDQLLAELNQCVDGEDGAARPLELAEHLAGCPRCRTVVENVRQTVAAYRRCQAELRQTARWRTARALKRRWAAAFEVPGDGQRTPQQEIVLQELCKVTSHPTAIEVLALARRRLPWITLTTVRRSLATLTRSGLIQKLESAGFAPRFDGNAAPHDHLRCQRCGKVDDRDRVLAELPRWGRAALRRFETPDCRVEYVGTCPGCQE
jgi:Fur family ferric uptake transcriptional regulator